MNLMFQPLRKYADFQGRARRSEYWLFYLFCLVTQIAIIVIFGGQDEYDEESFGLGDALALLFALAVLIPSLAVGVRRLHDTERSGWWLLIGLIPIIGVLVLLVFSVLDGTPGRNKFGPDPKGRGAPLPEEVTADEAAIT